MELHWNAVDLIGIKGAWEGGTDCGSICSYLQIISTFSPGNCIQCILYTVYYILYSLSLLEIAANSQQIELLSTPCGWHRTKGVATSNEKTLRDSSKPVIQNWETICLKHESKIVMFALSRTA